MIQCDSDKPRCQKKAIVLLLLKGMQAPGAQEATVVACCSEHANDMLYGKAFRDAAGVTLAESFVQGYGVLTESYRVLFLTEEMHQDPASLYELKLGGTK